MGQAEPSAALPLPSTYLVPALRADRLAIELLIAPSYDTNAAQEDSSTATPADGLALLLGSLELNGQWGAHTTYRSILEGGTKNYLDATAEDTVILRLAASTSTRLMRPLFLQTEITAKDRHQPANKRSYRSGSGQLGLALGWPSGLACGASFIGVAFDYLPAEFADRYDHLGLGGELFLYWSQYHLSLQGLSLHYPVGRVVQSTPEDHTEPRKDQQFRLDLSFQHRGAVVTSQNYYAQFTDSNLPSGRSQKVGAQATVGVSLPLEIDLILKASFLWAKYFDQVNPAELDDPNQGVEDDERRSSVGGALRHGIYDRLAFEIRWTYYFTLWDGSDYQRQLVLIGLRYSDEL